MPREKEGFRDQLESILTAFPGGELLYPSDVAGYLGMSKQFARKHFSYVRDGSGKPYITRVQLARQLCEVEKHAL